MDTETQLSVPKLRGNRQQRVVQWYTRDASREQDAQTRRGRASLVLTYMLLNLGRCFSNKQDNNTTK